MWIPQKCYIELAQEVLNYPIWQKVSGVLVAISIPIFTNQLEKSREAVDESNVRALYAAVSADVLSESATNETSNAAGIKDATITVSKGTDNVWTGTGKVKLTQQKDGLESGEAVNIGGINVDSNKWKKGGSITIVVKSDGSTPTIEASTSE